MYISEKTGVAIADLNFGNFHGLHLQFALESEGEINEMSYLTKMRAAQERLLTRVNKIRADEFAGRTYVVMRKGVIFFNLCHGCTSKNQNRYVRVIFMQVVS